MSRKKELDKETFAEVDRYLEGLFAPEDAVLSAATRAANEAGLPEIAVSVIQGKFLYLMAKLAGAKRILEVGTLAGFSTIWLGRALPEGGKLISLEFEARHAEVARSNIDRAGLTDKVTVMEGTASDSMKTLVERGEEPFDVVFLDANKDGYVDYLEWSLKLTRPGSLILADNVVRSGKVLDPPEDDSSARGAAAFNQELARDTRVEAVAFQQIGAKGHDGLAMAIVK
jgi:predicted O-methyltransferase YrrM